MRAPRLLALVAVLVAGFALIPVGYVLLRGGVSLGALVDTLTLPTTMGYLVNTVLLTILVPLASVVLGVLLAVLVVRTDLPGRRIWAMLFALPLGIPAFVGSYAWVSLSYAVNPASTALFGLPGAVLILGSSLYPYVFLPVVAALRSLDTTQEEMARSLGHGLVATFLKVTLPQLRPALSGGALIIALHMLAEYGALVLLRYQTLTTAIMARYEFGRAEEALLLSTLLTVLCLAVLGFDRLLFRGVGRAAPDSRIRLGSGVTRTSTPAPLHAWQVPALLGSSAVVFIGLVVPLTGIFGGLFQRLFGSGFADYDWLRLLTAIGNTASVGALAALVTTLVAIPVSMFITRHPSTLSMLTERATWITRSLPGIVVALALVFLASRYLPGLYQTIALMVLGYVLLFLPLAVGAQRSGLLAAAPQFDELSRSLGQGPLTTFRRVTLPLALPGIASGALLVFLDVGKELTATLLLHPTGFDMLSTGLWSRTELLDYKDAAPYALALVVLSSIPAYFLARRMLR